MALSRQLTSPIDQVFIQKWYIIIPRETWWRRLVFRLSGWASQLEAPLASLNRASDHGGLTADEPPKLGMLWSLACLVTMASDRGEAKHGCCGLCPVSELR
jgi:hypothetical protein